MNLGLRYDYLQPYHEAKNRIAFLNPTLMNPIVGIPGVLEYAGFGAGPNPAYSPYICQCTVPVKPYNLNIQPRLGFSYAASQSFVIRGGYGLQYTHSGGTGGGANFRGTGNNGEFGASSSYGAVGQHRGTRILPEPLDSYITRQASRSSLRPFRMTTRRIFPYTTPGANVNPLATTGNYNYTTFFPDKGNDYGCLPSGDGQTCNPSNLNYSDPYYGGRGPQYVNYNLGIQQMINKKAVLSVNYAGSQTHFLSGGSGRGPATNNISPDYANELRGILGGAAGASIAAVQSIIPNYKLPYPGFSGPGATVAKSLVGLPAVRHVHRSLGLNRQFELQLAADLCDSAAVAQPVGVCELHPFQVDRRYARTSYAVPGWPTGRQLHAQLYRQPD